MIIATYSKSCLTSVNIGKAYGTLIVMHIGGHGFLDKGGVYTLGVSEKNFAAASGGRTTGV